MAASLRDSHSPWNARARSLLGWAALLLLVLAFGAYLNADHELFLFDSKHIEQVEQTGGALGAVRDFLHGQLNPDAPLTFLTFALNRAFNESVGLDGFEITSFLLVNILLHGLNGLLVLILLRGLLKLAGADDMANSWILVLLAALFVVHPIHASSVAYIIQRRGLLATTFYLLGVISFLRVRATSGLDGTWTRGRLAWLVAVPVFYWLSLRAKNLGLTLPLTCLVIEVFLRAQERVPWKKIVALLGGMLMLSSAAIFVFLGKRGFVNVASLSIGHFGPEPTWGLWEHFLTESRVIVHYWKLLLLPLPQWSCIDHDFSVSAGFFDGLAGVSVAFHGVLLAVAVWAARRQRFLVAMGVAWFYVTLIPYAFLPQPEVFAEYKTYLPSVGLILVLAGLLRLPGRQVSARLQIAVLVIVITGLMALTVSRNTIYQSRVNLWTDAVQKSPGKWRTHYNLGVALAEEESYAEAEHHYSEALRLEPRLYLAHSNLAGILAEQGRHDEAIVHYREVLVLHPESSLAHYRLANTLARAGQTDEAVHHYLAALAIEPDLVEAHANLGIVLVRGDRLNEGIEHLRTAARLRPDSAAIQRELQELLAPRTQESPVEDDGETGPVEEDQSGIGSVPRSSPRD